MTAPLDEKGLLDRICHKEQIGIWANEVLTALSLGDFLREEWSFDDTVDAEREIEAQFRSIIASAISHPEYDLMAKITSAEAQVLRLTEEINALRRQVNAYAYQRDCAREERDKAESRSENFWRPQMEAAEARIKALEEALRPFAALLDEGWASSHADNVALTVVWDPDHVGGKRVPMKDFRAARSALKENAL